MVDKMQFQQGLHLLETTNVPEEKDALLEFGYDWNVVALEM